MAEEILIRSGEMHDLLSVIEFNRAMARETEDKELDLEILSAGVEAVLSNPQYGFYLIAETEGHVVGCLMVTYEWSDWRNGLFWWIQSVYVKPDFRGRGIYKRLYADVKRRAAAENNVCGFRLYVEKENARAQKTYQALGMIETHYKMFEELLPSDEVR